MRGGGSAARSSDRPPPAGRCRRPSWRSPRAAASGGRRPTVPQARRRGPGRRRHRQAQARSRLRRRGASAAGSGRPRRGPGGSRRPLRRRRPGPAGAAPCQGPAGAPTCWLRGSRSCLRELAAQSVELGPVVVAPRRSPVRSAAPTATRARVRPLRPRRPNGRGTAGSRRGRRGSGPGTGPHPAAGANHAIERRRPLLRTPEVERLLERLDRGAVHGAGVDRRDLAGGHGEHRLVEERDAAIDLADVDQGLAQPKARHRAQLRLVEPGRRRRDLFEEPEGGVVIPAVARLEGGGYERDRSLRAIVRKLLEEPGHPSDPATCLGQLPALGQVLNELERRTDRPSDVAGPEGGSVRPFPGLTRVDPFPDHMLGGRQPLEVVDAESIGCVGSGQTLSGLRPRVAIERGTRRGRGRWRSSWRLGLRAHSTAASWIRRLALQPAAPPEVGDEREEQDAHQQQDREERELLAPRPGPARSSRRCWR